jgi:hypothetical protein
MYDSIAWGGGVIGCLGGLVAVMVLAFLLPWLVNDWWLIGGAFVGATIGRYLFTRGLSNKAPEQSDAPGPPDDHSAP